MKMIAKSSVFLIVVTFVSTASSSSQKCEPVPGCTDNGVFYPIGASVPQNSPCKTCYCAENGLECAEIACDAPPPGCVTQNNPDQCCPEILYCGCEVDGAIIKIGEDIPDNDPCLTCTCEASDNGAKPVCWGVACGQGWPSNCAIQNVPDKCCPVIQYCGCLVDGTIYKFGEEIPDNDPCVTCTCEGSDVRGSPSCFSMSCLAPPPGCENAQPSPGVCCPDYQALGCETMQTPEMSTP